MRNVRSCFLEWNRDAVNGLLAGSSGFVLTLDVTQECRNLRELERDLLR